MTLGELLQSEFAARSILGVALYHTGTSFRVSLKFVPQTQQIDQCMNFGSEVANLSKTDSSYPKTFA
jgi:hypothetical protein